MDGIETYVQMVGRVAAAMYNAPDPNDPDAPSDPWPPIAPERSCVVDDPRTSSRTHH